MALSPMMQQYHEAKQAAGDALLLFRMGDFYELFYDDAKTAARVLGLSLTSRDKGENPVPMAGFPHHQLDQYLAKIIAAGLSGGDLRADGRSRRQAKGTGEARHHPGGESRHGDRRRAARPRGEQLPGGAAP